MNLTKQEIKNKNLKVYYRVVEWDEMYFQINDIVGRYETLKEARQACYKWWDEVSEESWLEIQKYKLNEKSGKYEAVKDDYKI